MNKTELHKTNEIGNMSDEDLDAVAGGFRVYTGGGGGHVVPGNFAQTGAEPGFAFLAGVFAIGFL
jgi:hypothetical protein